MIEKKTNRGFPPTIQPPSELNETNYANKVYKNKVLPSSTILVFMGHTSKNIREADHRLKKE